MNKLNSIIYFTVIILAAVGLLIWIAGPDKDKPDNNQSAHVSTSLSSNLTIEDLFFDFGSVSMANGVVARDIKIKNTGNGSTTVKEMYTSCMCTNASLMKGDEKLGPFGMPGHGLMPKINSVFNPGEEAVVRVEFDPAAHGPAGVGPVDRVVYIAEKDGGKPLEIKFKALVTP